MLDLSQLLSELQLNTEQSVREKALADAVFLSIGDGVIATNEEGKIQRINKAALDILGYKEHEILGKWFPQVVVSITEDNKIVPPLERGITRSVITGKTISERTFYKTKSNKRLPVSVTVSPIMMNDRPLGAIEVFRDITQEYEVDRMKSEFISIASHQLRTPLSAIHTYSEMLFSGYAGKLTKEQQNFMKIILSSIDRMNELITTLLDISKIESGQLQINSSKVNYNKVVKSIIDEFSAQANSKQISLTFKKPEDPVQVIADPLLLMEVCANLVSNALKYTPVEGEVAVTLKQKEGTVVLSVKDTGYGIPRSSQANMFSKFFRAGNVLQKETYGTGLGLYMVKLIANTMGGEVWFKSRENKGSTFYFSLPADISEADLPERKTING